MYNIRLSAIMLGRLQMSVDEAIELYDIVGNNIFAKPRFPMLPAWTKVFVTRYSSTRMEKTLISAMERPLRPEWHRRKDDNLARGEIPLENENPDAAQT